MRCVSIGQDRPSGGWSENLPDEVGVLCSIRLPDSIGEKRERERESNFGSSHLPCLLCGGYARQRLLGRGGLSHGRRLPERRWLETTRPMPLPRALLGDSGPCAAISVRGTFELSCVYSASARDRDIGGNAAGGWRATAAFRGEPTHKVLEGCD